MAENPLLPNAKLSELYALMRRARTLTASRAAAPRFEAILCSTLMHVEPGDFVATLPAAPGAATLAAERTSSTPRRKSLPVPPTLPATHRLATVTGIAQALKSAGANRMAVYFAEAGAASSRTQAGWREALAYAQSATLPLLFICGELTGAAAVANKDALTWQSISKFARPVKFPIVTVDGTDAPAFYRVMQESTLRVRTGGGPAILWALLPKSNTPATDPIRHMKRYLADRKLLPRKTI